MQSDCLRQIPTPYLMCGLHWAKVPGHVKRAVCTRLKGWKNAGAARQYLFDWLQQQKKGSVAE
jgi:hypothetical protein